MTYNAFATVEFSTSTGFMLSEALVAPHCNDQHWSQFSDMLWHSPARYRLSLCGRGIWVVRFSTRPLAHSQPRVIPFHLLELLHQLRQRYHINAVGHSLTAVADNRQQDAVFHSLGTKKEAWALKSYVWPEVDRLRDTAQQFTDLFFILDLKKDRVDAWEVSRVPSTSFLY